MRNDLKPMRNASFLRINDRNSMRNTILYFISHSVILMIYSWLLCNLWEYEKWKWKIVCRGRADINAGNYHTNVFQENDKSDKSIS